MTIDTSFLGTGWSFPPAFDRKIAQPVMVSDEEDISQSLDIILSTSLGERVLRPNFGCDLKPVFCSMKCVRE